MLSKHLKGICNMQSNACSAVTWMISASRTYQQESLAWHRPGRRSHWLGSLFHACTSHERPEEHTHSNTALHPCTSMHAPPARNLLILTLSISSTARLSLTLDLLRLSSVSLLTISLALQIRESSHASRLLTLGLGLLISSGGDSFALLRGLLRSLGLGSRSVAFPLPGACTVAAVGEIFGRQIAELLAVMLSEKVGVSLSLKRVRVKKQFILTRWRSRSICRPAFWR